MPLIMRRYKYFCAIISVSFQDFNSHYYKVYKYYTMWSHNWQDHSREARQLILNTIVKQSVIQMYAIVI